MKHEHSEEELADAAANIDWKEFGQFHQTLYCRCGGVWRNHHIARVIKGGNLAFLTMDPCPKCGKRGDVRSAEGDPERF